MGLALALPSLPTTLLGFALAGLGVATLIPAVYHAADELPGLRRGVGLAVVNWLLRIGFLLSPLVIGVLADATSLRVALVTVVVAGVGRARAGRGAAAGRILAEHQPTTPPPTARAGGAARGSVRFDGGAT